PPKSSATVTCAGFISANGSLCNGRREAGRMALTQRLELRQGQSLVMTPQLQQAIKLLQLSNLELAEYVEAEIEKNPLLERGEPEPATNGEDRQPESGPASDEPLESALAREDFSKAEDLDADKGD